jgi:hypothetical protein
LGEVSGQGFGVAALLREVQPTRRQMRSD